MKYPGTEPVQSRKKPQQINLNLDVSGGTKSSLRPFSSSSTRSSTTQKSGVSILSESQKSNRGAINQDHVENKTKKNVIFSREATDMANHVIVKEKNSTEISQANNLNDSHSNINKQRAHSASTRALPKGNRSSNNNAIITPSSPRLSPTRQTSPKRTAHPVQHTAKPATGVMSTADPRVRPQSRGRLRSRESSVQSEDVKPSSPNSRRGKRKVEKLKLRSNSFDSSSSDENSPRSSARYSAMSQSLSPESQAALEAVSQAQKQAWSQFETHVKLIDDSTDLITRQPRRTFNSSNVFQSVMCDMYGNIEYGKSKGFTKLRSQVGNIATYASRFIGKVKALHALKGYDDDIEEDYDEMDFYQPSKQTIANAQRGWRILRHYVQEMAAEKRMSQSTLSWDMLRHTVRGLTNMERARYDLYQRYGIVPTVKSDGTVVQENTMLSERARSALANKPKNPVMNRYHSATTKRPKVYKSIDGFMGYSRAVTP